MSFHHKLLDLVILERAPKSVIKLFGLIFCLKFKLNEISITKKFKKTDNPKYGYSKYKNII